MVKIRIFHEDTFYEFFEPYRHPETQFDIWGEIGLETFGKDLEIVQQIDPGYLWTVVDGSTGNDQWITPGFRYVNRVCYLVTRKAHKSINVDFRVRNRPSSLTPLGIRRQMTSLERLWAGPAVREN
jgi:hypothetical protein